MRNFLLLGCILILSSLFWGCSSSELAGTRTEIKAGEAQMKIPQQLASASDVPNPYDMTAKTGRSTAAAAKAKESDQSGVEELPAESSLPPVPQTPVAPPPATAIQPEAAPAAAAFTAFVTAIANRNGAEAWNYLTSAAKTQMETVYAQLKQQAEKDPNLAAQLATFKSGKDLWVDSINKSSPGTGILAEATVAGAELKGNTAILILRTGEKVSMVKEGGGWKLNPNR